MPSQTSVLHPGPHRQRLSPPSTPTVTAEKLRPTLCSTRELLSCLAVKLSEVVAAKVWSVVAAFGSKLASENAKLTL